jgi:hypothetical protein
MRRRALVPVVALLFAAPAAAKPPSTAETGATPSDKTDAVRHFADILVLHATNEKKGIDRRIGDMPELTKPPFSSYDSYALVDRGRLPLEKGVPKTLVLPNRRVLEARLIDILGNDSVRLAASINQPGGKEFLPLLEVKAKIGQPFIVAGQSYKRGILVLVIKVVR